MMQTWIKKSIISWSAWKRVIVMDQSATKMKCWRLYIMRSGALSKNRDNQGTDEMLSEVLRGSSRFVEVWCAA